MSAMMENGVVMLLATILPYNKAYKQQANSGAPVDWNAIAVKVANPVFAPPMPGMPYQGQDEEEEARLQVRVNVCVNVYNMCVFLCMPVHVRGPNCAIILKLLELNEILQAVSLNENRLPNFLLLCRIKTTQRVANRSKNFSSTLLR